MNESSESRIITFYSYKGGVGRSMALANIAWILASNGKRVLMVDWDLEAPGLHRYFFPFLDAIVTQKTTLRIEHITRTVDSRLSGDRQDISVSANTQILFGITIKL